MPIRTDLSASTEVPNQHGNDEYVEVVQYNPGQFPNTPLFLLLECVPDCPWFTNCRPLHLKSSH